MAASSTVVVEFRRSERKNPARATDADPFRFEIVSDRARFDALAPQWDALFERSATPNQIFQSHWWLSAWADHFLTPPLDLAIVVGWRGEALAMAWPMVAQKRMGVTQISWMGEPASQYGDALVEGSEDRDELLLRGWHELRALGADVVHLRKTRADSTVASIAHLAGLVTVAQQNAPYVDLASAPTWEALDARYDAKLRSARRRLNRRLAETGVIGFEAIPPGGRASRMLRQALAFKRARFQRDAILAPTLTDKRFEAMLADVARESHGRLTAIGRNGEAIGVEFSLKCKDALFGYIIAHDQRFEKQGLGVTLAGHVIRAAHDDGFSRYDLLAPADPYKMSWAQGAVEVRDLAASLTWRGRIYERAWTRFGRAQAKRFADRLPGFLRRILRLFLS